MFPLIYYYFFLLWILKYLKILADPSIHGAENVIKVMKEIDADTPWPEEHLEFTTLWCRVVSLRCKEWKFQLRDFPQPLLDIRQCYICGQLVGAEQVAPRRGKVQLSVYFIFYRVVTMRRWSAFCGKMRPSCP